MPVNPMIGASGGNTGFFDSSSIGLRQDLGNYSPETQNTITSEERKRRIANMLLQRGMQPRQGQMTGRFFTPPSKWEQGSDLAQAALGAYMNWDASDTEKKAVEAETEKVGRIRKSVAQALMMQGQGQDAIAAQPAHMVPTSGVGYEDAPAETMVPATQGSAAVPAGPASVDQRLQALRATRSMDGADSPLAIRLVDAEEKALLGEQTREDTQKHQDAQQKLALAEHALTREQTAASMAASLTAKREHDLRAEKLDIQIQQMRGDLQRELTGLRTKSSEKIAAMRKKSGAGPQYLGANIQAAEDILGGITRDKDGEIIGQAPLPTGSLIGSWYDKAGGLFGQTPEGATQAAELETLASWMTLNVPRLEGPQSDRDTKLYKEAAADAGDRQKTREVRLAALKTLRRIMETYPTVFNQEGEPSKPVEAKHPRGAGKPTVSNW